MSRLRMGRPRVWEALAVVSAVAIGPLLLRWLNDVTGGALLSLAYQSGHGSILERVVGAGGAADSVAFVAAARGLAEPGVSAYEPLGTLYGLVGLDWSIAVPHTHPPTEFVLGLPLAWLPYSTWLPFWIIAMVAAIAVTLRVLEVPAFVAYPAALLISAVGAGEESLLTTYPLAALLLALTWRFRRRGLIAGLLLGFMAAWRGLVGILLVYFTRTRQWATIGWAVGVLVVLTAIAWALEPDVIHAFLTVGREAIAVETARSDNTSMVHLADLIGLPLLGVAIVAAGVVVWGLYRGASLFWLLVWFSLAVSPVAWSYAVIGALPLMVVVWRAGRWGVVASLVVAWSAAVSADNWGPAWPVMIMLSGVVLVGWPQLESPAGGVRLTEAHRPWADLRRSQPV